MAIFELRDRVLILPTLENRMKSIQSEIHAAQNDVSSLLRQYECESRDVERIKKDSFSAFLLKLTGRYEDKLEKEQCEEINAKIAYDRAVLHLQSLVREKDELASRIQALKADEMVYHAELDAGGESIPASCRSHLAFDTRSLKVSGALLFYRLPRLKRR